MIYVRQLLFKCKDSGFTESLYLELQTLSQIEHVRNSIMMECMKQNKYDYIDCRYDFSLLLFFSDLNDIEKYCTHPIHERFVRKMLNFVDVVVFDYSVNE